MTQKRSQSEIARDDQLDMDWHLSKHPKLSSSSPDLDLAQYFDLEQTCFSPQTAEPELLRVETEAARREVRREGERWQNILQKEVHSMEADHEERQSQIISRIQALEKGNEDLRNTLLSFAKTLESKEALGLLSVKAIDHQSSNIQSKLKTNDAQEERLYESITLPAPAPARPPIPQSRAVRISNLPKSMTYEMLYKLIRGGPVEQIFYDTNVDFAVIWFIEPASAKNCLDFSQEHDISIDANVLKYSLFDAHLARSPPGRAILDAPRHNITPVIHIDSSSFTVREAKHQFEAYGKVITANKLKSGTLRVVYSSIHDAITAMRLAPLTRSLQSSRMRFAKDDCADAFSDSLFLLKHCKPKQSLAEIVDDTGEPFSTIAPELTVKLPDSPSAPWISQHTAGKPKTSVFCDSSDSHDSPSEGRKILGEMTGSRGSRSSSNTASSPLKHKKYPGRADVPRQPCHLCNTRHWFRGPKSTPCPDKVKSSIKDNERWPSNKPDKLESTFRQADSSAQAALSAGESSDKENVPLTHVQPDTPTIEA